MTQTHAHVRWIPNGCLSLAIEGLRALHASLGKRPAAGSMRTRLCVHAHMLLTIRRHLQTVRDGGHARARACTPPFRTPLCDCTQAWMHAPRHGRTHRHPIALAHMHGTCAHMHGRTDPRAHERTRTRTSGGFQTAASGRWWVHLASLGSVLTSDRCARVYACMHAGVHVRALPAIRRHLRAVRDGDGGRRTGDSAIHATLLLSMSRYNGFAPRPRHRPGYTIFGCVFRFTTTTKGHMINSHDDERSRHVSLIQRRKNFPESNSTPTRLQKLSETSKNRACAKPNAQKAQPLTHSPTRHCACIFGGCV